MSDQNQSNPETAAAPPDLMQRPVLRWPAHVSHVTDIPENTLRKSRMDGDAPRLYAIGRALFTTPDDLRDWILRHELEPGGRVRPPTVPRGPRRPTRRAGEEVAA